MRKYLLLVAVFSIICSPNIYAYDTKYSLHGVRTSFLLGKLYSSKYNTSLMYLSETWNDAERSAYINRLLNNGDTHIDVYARATSGNLPGGHVNGNANFRPRLVELNARGLKPVLWMTPESKHGDAYASDAEHREFMERMIRLYDDQVSAYVACLECDEYWSAAQVNEYVRLIKSKTSKPVAVHLAPGVGGYKKDINYYAEADYIYLQIGDHLTGDYTADVELAKRMLNEALQLGKPVVANEYALKSESAQARALGDLMCQMGAVGTGNGRSITFCGEEAVTKKKNDYSTEIVGIALVALGAYYLHSTYDFELMLNATEDYQTYGLGKSFNITENTQVGVSYARTELTHNEDDSIMFYYKGTFNFFD